MYFIQSGCVQVRDASPKPCPFLLPPPHPPPIIFAAPPFHMPAVSRASVQITNHDRSVVFITLMPGAYFGELAMLTTQRRTATAQAIADCILFYLHAADFDEVIKDFPSYYDIILDGAMLRLEKTLQSNASLEARMAVVKTRNDLLRHRHEKFGGLPPSHGGGGGGGLGGAQGADGGGMRGVGGGAASRWAALRAVVNISSVSSPRAASASATSAAATSSQLAPSMPRERPACPDTTKGACAGAPAAAPCRPLCLDHANGSNGAHEEEEEGGDGGGDGGGGGCGGGGGGGGGDDDSSTSVSASAPPTRRCDDDACEPPQRRLPRRRPKSHLPRLQLLSSSSSSSQASTLQMWHDQAAQDAALAKERGSVPAASFRARARERCCCAKLGGGGGGRGRGPDEGRAASATTATACAPPPQLPELLQSEVLAAIRGLAAQMAELQSLQTAQRAEMLSVQTAQKAELAEIRDAVSALRQ